MATRKDYGLTVGKLRKALKGLSADMPVYTRDHDQSEWETNGRASRAEVINQEYLDDYAKERLEKDDGIFKKDGDYFVVSA